MAFYEDWYAPNNAVLVMQGDITADEVRPLVEKYYGALPRREVPSRDRLVEPPHKAPRQVELESPRVRQPVFWIEYLAPSYSHGATEHAYPLQLLDEIIGGGATSRLYSNLVVEQGVAAGAGTGYTPGGLGPSSFRVYATPRPGTDIDVVEEALRAEIAELLTEGVTESEVETAKTRLTAAAIYARDRLGTAANIFGRALTSGQSVEDIESWPERIQAVTAEQVNAAVRAVFQDKSSVTARLLPEPTS